MVTSSNSANLQNHNENKQGNHVHSHNIQEDKLQKPKSILKKKKEPVQKRNLLWDEQNLMHNEAHKTAVMKIDEPKTPFNHVQYYEDEEDPDGPLVPRSPPEEEENVKMVEGSEMNWNALESAVSSAVDQRSRWDRDSSSSDKEERSESEDDEKKNFKLRRKLHYNEYHALRMWKTKIKDDTVGSNTKEE